jgi:hypothetical protein
MSLGYIRLVGTVTNDSDRLLFQGLWSADDGEFDEESFDLGLGDKFYFQSQLGSSLDSFQPNSHVSVKGKFMMKIGLTSHHVFESAQLYVVDSPSQDSSCCKPVNSESLGLLGLHGSGRNQVGRFKLLGSYHLASQRFWLTKTYDSVPQVKFNLSSADQLHAAKLAKKEKRKRDLEDLEQEKSVEAVTKKLQLDQQLHVLSQSSSSSLSVNEGLLINTNTNDLSKSVQDMVKNVASIASLQSQVLSSITFLQKRVSELEVKAESDKLKFENSLRVLSDRIAFLSEGHDSLHIETDLDPKNALLRTLSGSGSASKSQSTSTIKSTIKSRPLHCKKKVQELTEEERKSLPFKISSLTDSQMASLVSKIREEDIFPLPLLGEFEIDLESLSTKQLFQFHLVLRQVMSHSFAFANGDDNGDCDL